MSKSGLVSHPIMGLGYFSTILSGKDWKVLRNSESFDFEVEFYFFNFNFEFLLILGSLTTYGFFVADFGNPTKPLYSFTMFKISHYVYYFFVFC